jgi:uncharacterized protein (TIGR02145 family)
MQLRKLIFTLLAMPVVGFSALQAQAVKDVEGNIYPTTTIGQKVWMAENLRTTKYNDGTPILLVTGDNEWGSLKKAAYCWYNNNIENGLEYGALYNYSAATSKKICPVGWHVASNEEWTTLVAVLGNEATAGNKLKEAGMDHWNNALVAVTNEYDFTALPAGYRAFTGNFPADGNNYAIWWTTSEFDAEKAWNRGLYFNTPRIFNGYRDKRSGFSIRCVKDK